MDEFFGGMEGRFRVSITDSTMMKIVHCAMNRAHEKLKSKEGVMERLNDISKFYELAVMQLEGCMKFVQEETDMFVVESSHEEELMAGLTEIRNRLRVRLGDSEMAIRDKDREMAERLNSELKLSQALELKERELAALRAELKLEKKTSSEDRAGEFCELKNSVDQQVWNIRQKLEPHQYYNNNSDNKLESIESHNDKVEQMGSDIDVLKETLDVAFGKMSNAIILSEVAPVEQQWRWGIEKDTIFIFLKGLMRDLQDNCESKMGRFPDKESFSGESWTNLTNQVAELRTELESLFGYDEKQFVEDDCRGKSDKSLAFDESDLTEGLLEEATEEGGSHYVAKMIKSHESIIRKKSAEAEELNFLRREIMRGKLVSSCKREKESVSLNKRVREIIVSLDNLMELNAKFSESFCDDHYRDMNGQENVSGERSSGFDSLVVNEEEVPNKMGRLELELEELNLRTKIMEDTYITLFEGLSKELNIELCGYDLENAIWESRCKDLVEEMTEMTNRWNVKIETNYIESQIREEIDCIVFNEAIKDCSSSFYELKLGQYEDLRDEKNCLEDSVLTETLDNVIKILIFSETFKEWTKRREGYETDTLFREEICNIVFDETTKSISEATSSVFGRFKEAKLAEISIKDDVCAVFMRETIEEWKIELDAYNTESVLREEILQFVIFEAVKDAFTLSKQVDPDNCQEKLLGCMFCDDKLQKCKQHTKEESLIHMVDSLQNCLQVEEHLMLNISSELRENNINLHCLLGLECEDLDECESFFGKKNKLEKSLQQLATSKETLTEIVSSLGLVFGDQESVSNRGTCTMTIVQDKESFIVKPEEDLSLSSEKEQVNSNSDSAAISILGFLQVMVNFELKVREMLEMNNMRLEQINHQIDPLVEIVSSLREKESLYKKAFIRRCQNLHKAETEVDLLGDQVEVLLRLLQKIYTTLHHYSPILHQHAEFSELLQLIKKALNQDT